jgi:cation transport ATPase
MVTGDNSRSAAKVASLLGIAEVHDHQLPDQKHALVRSIEESTKKPVIMVRACAHAPLPAPDH